MEIDAFLAFLESLKDMGVEEFSQEKESFYIKFFTPMPEAVDQDGILPERRKPVGNSFQHPALWAGGEPPKFPGK